MDALKALSPLDGRYAAKVGALSDYFSEFALNRYRVMVEVEYLIALLGAIYGTDVGRVFPVDAFDRLRGIYAGFSEADAQAIKAIERKINHDVKAVEYFVKDRLREIPGFENEIEKVHFGLTSEDTNNLAYACMLRDALQDVMLPALGEVLAALIGLAKKTKSVPMLARTHGQPASPTTVGKELAVFLSRLEGEIAALKDFRLYGKLNGATGTFGALVAAYPKFDWLAFAGHFVSQLDLVPNLITTQIESHDRIAALFDQLRRIHNILLDLDQDMWRYISDGYFRQKPVAAEVGSSTMPHKVNPIDFENSEGNLGLANALLVFMAEKLPKSRLQRDLSDSTVLRNMGVAWGYALLAYQSTVKGLKRLAVDTEKVANELSNHPEVLAEAIQTVLRAQGHPAPYEALKETTRGEAVTMAVLHELLDRLEMDEATRARLKAMTPEGYTGYAERLAEIGIAASEKLLLELRG
ncbi:adenylosuccinate lyase [bacterium]|nr:adenylosuccinate lyase [bacterium]